LRVHYAGCMPTVAEARQHQPDISPPHHRNAEELKQHKLLQQNMDAALTAAVVPAVPAPAATLAAVPSSSSSLSSSSAAAASAPAPAPALAAQVYIPSSHPAGLHTPAAPMSLAPVLHPRVASASSSSLVIATRPAGLLSASPREQCYDDRASNNLAAEFDAVTLDASSKFVKAYKPKAALGALFQCTRGGHCWHQATGSHHLMCAVVDCTKCWWSHIREASPELLQEMLVYHYALVHKAAPPPARCLSWTDAAPSLHSSEYFSRQLICGTVLEDGTECSNRIRRKCGMCGQLSQLKADDDRCPCCNFQDASFAATDVPMPMFGLSPDLSQEHDDPDEGSTRQRNQHESVQDGANRSFLAQAPRQQDEGHAQEDGAERKEEHEHPAEHKRDDVLEPPALPTP